MNHSKIQLEIDWQLNSILQAETCPIISLAENLRLSRVLESSYLCECMLLAKFQLHRLLGSCQKKLAAGGWVGGFMRIMPHCDSILQAGTCQILCLAENPIWSQVWKETCCGEELNGKKCTNRRWTIFWSVWTCKRFIFVKHFYMLIPLQVDQ